MTQADKNRKIINILRKKHPTGKEVGQVLFADFIRLEQDLDKKEGRKTPLIPFERLSEMQGSLRGTERATFRVYALLLQAFINTMNVNDTMKSHFLHGVKVLSNEIELANLAEQSFKRRTYSPLILTKDEHKNLTGQAKKFLENEKLSFYEIFEKVFNTIISECIKGLGSPVIPPNVRDVLEQYKTRPSFPSLELKTFNIKTNRGKLTDKKGRVITSLTLDEMGVFARYRHDKNLVRLFFEGSEALREYANKKGVKKLATRLGKKNNDVLDGLEKYLILDPMQRDRELIELFDELNENENPFKFTFYPPPKASEFDRYTFLTTCENLENFAAFMRTDKEKVLDVFAETFPELFEAIKAYLISNNSLFDVPSWDYHDRRFFKITLSDIRLLGFENSTRVDHTNLAHFFEKNALDFTKTEQIRYGGVAILDDVASPAIQLQDPFAMNAEVYSILGISKEKEARLSFIWNEFIDFPLRRIFAFNAVANVLESVYEINGLGEIQTNIDLIKEQTEAFNRDLHRAYLFVFGDDSTRDRKRKRIKELFKPIHLNDFLPEQAAVDLAREGFKTVGTSVFGYYEVQQLESVVLKIVRGEQ